jgi:tRNA-guanine family transglycosylase
MIKNITFGQYTLKTPAIFASYRLGDFPSAGLKSYPWRVTETEALLINAFDFKRPKFQKHLENGWSIEKYLDFPDKPVMIDSGAYYFLKRPHIKVAPEEILEIELKVKAHIGVVLDHPFLPNAPDKKQRISTTIRNTKQMLLSLSKRQSPMELMPVVHGHTKREIRDCIRQIQRLMSKMQIQEITRIGIGSIAPLAKQGNGKLASEVIKTVREELPNAHLHCFSMGSALSMLLAFYSGADTVDSQSWILSAAFKLAQLPGHYVVRLANREHKTESGFKTVKNAFALRIKALHDTEGYCVKHWQTGEWVNVNCNGELNDYVDSLSDRQSNENLHNRACHNLWTYNFEARKAREAINKGEWGDFIRKRLLNTRYKTCVMQGNE